MIILYFILCRFSLGREVGIVRRMPTIERRVFTLRKVYEHSQAQIASELHLSATQVDEALVRATRLFAAGLERSAEPR